MAAAQSKLPTVKLLLMGITGSGKSSTGNSILGRKQFHSGGSFKSVTGEVSCGYAEVDDCILHVIDGPGLEATTAAEKVDGPGLEATTAADKVDDQSMAIKNVGQALSICNGYVDAVLLVIKYGERFTKDQKHAVEAVQRIIGKEGMQKFGIIVITRKKKWDKDQAKTHSTLERWCRDKDNECGNIFSLCKFRSVLFENKLKKLTDKESQSQRTDLLKCVQGMKAHGTYTNEHFKRAECERSKYITLNKCLILKEAYQQEINLLYSKIGDISDTGSEDGNLKRYKDIDQRAKALMKEIEKEDGGSGALMELKNTLEQIVEAADKKNGETLKKLGYEIEKLRTEKKATLTYAILSGIATVLTLGIATPLLIRKLKELTFFEETIASHEKTMLESQN